MTLLQYIDNRDAFQTYYTMHLSNRLIHGLSASNEEETSMISKLTVICGFQYGNDLEKMRKGDRQAHSNNLIEC